MNGVVLERMLARGPVRGAAPTLDAGDAAVVLRAVARALLTRHADGTTHGAVGPAAVVIGRDGGVTLREPSLRPTASTAQDLQGFARLARTLAASWTVGDPTRRGLIERSGSAALTAGLAEALEMLRLGAPWSDSSRLGNAAAEIAGPVQPVPLPESRSGATQAEPPERISA
ncbi:MAG: hypothetical protein OJJ54_08090 [Pseudonocardia sp.]|nr:hypothetical protein [Pseudonocardia sp.]